jgi:hypothetical protein
VSSFDISVPALIAERGGKSPVVRMKPVRCPRCGHRHHRFTAVRNDRQTRGDRVYAPA